MRFHPLALPARLAQAERRTPKVALAPWPEDHGPPSPSPPRCEGATLEAEGASEEHGMFVPDFTRIVAMSGELADAGLSACSAYLCYVGSLHAAAELEESIDEAVHGQLCDADGLLAALPSAVLEHLDGQAEELAAAWLARLHNVVRSVGARLAIGEVPVPRSVAEDLALYLACHMGDEWYDVAVRRGDDPNYDTFAARSPAGLESEGALGGFYGRLAALAGDVWATARRDVAEPPSGPAAMFAPYDAAVPPEAPGFPVREAPMPVRLGASPSLGEIRAHMQRFLDTVLRAGVVVEIAEDDGDAERIGGWTGRVAGLDLDGDFVVRLEPVPGAAPLGQCFGGRVMHTPVGRMGVIVTDLDDLRCFLRPEEHPGAPSARVGTSGKYEGTLHHGTQGRCPSMGGGTDAATAAQHPAGQGRRQRFGG